MLKILQWLIGGLVKAAPSWIGSALISLGITSVSFVGLDVLLTNVKAQISSSLSSGSNFEGFLGVLGVLQVGTCVNILASAYVARLVVRGLKNGAIRKFIPSPK